MTRSGGCYRLVMVVLLAIVLTGCYKKELDELDNLKNTSLKSERSFAFPLFEGSLTLKDSLPFSVPSLILADTIESNFNVNSYLPDYTGEVDYVELKLSIKTNFPITANIQLYFTDQNNVIIDSLFTIQNSIIEGGSNGIFNETIFTINMDKEKYKKIENSYRLIVRYNVQTSNSKQYAANEVDINAGIKFGVTF